MCAAVAVITLNRNCSIFNRLYNTHSHISLCIYRESSSTVECKETCQQVHTVTAPALRCALTKRAVLNMMSGPDTDLQETDRQTGSSLQTVSHSQCQLHHSFRYVSNDKHAGV